MGYIYKITNKVTNKCYIGQTIVELKQRWLGHIKKRSNCLYLKHAFEKYGKNNFEMTLLLTCADEELNKYELEYIQKYNSLVPNGYNLREGGNQGKMHEETKIKISNTLRNKYSNCKRDNKLSGKILSEEHKKKISKSIQGKPKTEVMKNKLKDINTKYIIKQYNYEGNLINTFNGGVEAANAMNVTKNSIYKACKNNTICKGFKWKYFEKPKE